MVVADAMEDPLILALAAMVRKAMEKDRQSPAAGVAHDDIIAGRGEGICQRTDGAVDSTSGT